jgi:UrcA family protein
MSFRASLIPGLVLAAALTAPLTARAADPDQPTVAVHIGDLDLGSDTGVAIARNRIVLAAREVCSAQDGRDLAHRALAEACRETARNDADAKLGTVVASIRGQTQYAMAGTPAATLH